MVDSEKAVNPIMDDSEEKNTAVNADNDFDLNLGDSEEEKSQNSSDLFSEDVKDGEATDEKELPKEEHDLFEDEAETENELFSNNESNDVSAEKKAEEDSVSLEDTDENIEEPTFDAPTIDLSDEESTVEDNVSTEDSEENIEEPAAEATTIDLSDEESTVEDNASTEDSRETIEEPAVEAHTIDLSDEESTVEDNASTEDSEESIEEPAVEAHTIDLSDEESTVEDNASTEDSEESIEEPAAEAATINLSDEESTVEDTASTEDSSDESEIPVAKPSFEDNFKERLKNAETLNNEDDEATANQDTSALLGKFDNVVIAPTIEKTESDSSITVDFSETIQEHPAVLEKSPITQANEKEEEERAKLIQKEKIAQLIKSHEKKGKRVGFTKGILSGIVLVACAVIVSCIFAKDQVLDIINSDFLNGLSLSANVVEVSNNTDEDKTDDEDVSDEENVSDDEDATEYEISSDNGTGADEQIAEVLEIANDEEATNDEEITNDEDTNIENINNEESDKKVDNTIYGNGYIITPVTTEEEANWVLPAHCSDLTCYGGDKEFTPCTTFRQAENLDENAVRIGNNGVCRYKDSSELVYVEFN